MSLHQFATAYIVGQTAARRYDRLVAEGTAPERAARAIFEDHYDTEKQASAPRTEPTPGSIIRPQPA